MKAITYAGLLVALSRTTTRAGIRIMPLRTADELSYLTELRCDDAIHIWLAGIDKDTGIWHQKTQSREGTRDTKWIR